MPTQRQKMELKLTPKLMIIQLDCAGAMVCGDCYPKDLPEGNVKFCCPPFKLKIKPLTKEIFTQKHKEPDDIYFS